MNGEAAEHARRASWAVRTHVALTIRAPTVCLCAGLTVALLLVVASGGLYPNIPGEGRNPYAVQDWIGTKKHDAMLLAMASTDVAGNADQQSLISREFILINYVASDGNILTLDKLKAVQKLDSEIVNHPQYADLCYRRDGQCKILSIVEYLTDDLTLNGTLPATQAELDDKLQKLVLPKGKSATEIQMSYQMQSAASFHFDDKFASSNLKSAMTRTRVFLGMPLQGYTSLNDRKFEQETKLAEWELKVSDETLDKYIVDYRDNHNIDYFYIGGDTLLQRHVNTRLLMDVIFALGSFVFVWAYMWYHTESCFLSSLGMFMVVLAFPAGRCISLRVFGVVWFDILNQLLIFLLLGVGADNMFITIDAWKQSEFADQATLCLRPGEDAIQARLEMSLQRASHAMMTTSFTTAASFFANILSGITPTAGFGIFAGTMLVMNYLYCVLIFPAAILVHHYYLKTQCSCCVSPCSCCLRCVQKKTIQPSSSSESWSLEKYSAPERVYYKWVSPFVIKYRLPITLIAFVWVICAGILCTWLQPSGTTPKFLPDDDAMQKTFDRLQCADSADMCYSGGSCDELTNVALMVFGVHPEPDRTGFSRFEDFTPSCKNSVCGKPRFDTSFDPSQPAIQELILKTCDDGMVVKDTVSLAHCVMSDFKLWLTFQGRAFPVPQADFAKAFEDFLYFEQTIAGKKVRPIRTKYIDSKLVGWENGQVTHMMVGWQTKYRLRTLKPYNEVKAVYDRYMDFEAQKRREFQSVVGGGEMYLCEAAGHDLFVTMAMSREFSDAVLRGVGVSFAVALVMLLFSTGNVIIAFISLFTIACITASTLASMWIYGWEIGVIEALCAVLVVGFSVDYTVHLGISYVERRPEDDGKYELGSSRADRTTHAFFELGVSVAAGCATTLGSSLFLFFCRVQLFKIFGIFMCTVIFWSLLLSHFFFMPLCALVGPVGTRGDLFTLKDIQSVIRRKPEANVQTSADNLEPTVPAVKEEDDDDGGKDDYIDF